MNLAPSWTVTAVEKGKQKEPATNDEEDCNTAAIESDNSSDGTDTEEDEG